MLAGALNLARMAQPWRLAEIVATLVTCPVKKLVYWCEFRRGPRVAPSETLYNLRRCYPKPMPRREGRKAIYSTSTTAAEAKKEARAVVERVARLC